MEQLHSLMHQLASGQINHLFIKRMDDGFMVLIDGTGGFQSTIGRALDQAMDRHLERLGLVGTDDEN